MHMILMPQHVYYCLFIIISDLSFAHTSRHHHVLLPIRFFDWLIEIITSTIKSFDQSKHQSDWEQEQMTLN